MKSLRNWIKTRKMQNQSTKIREIFTSIQGEGPYVGQKQIFVRFCKCNLKCDFCDTDFAPKDAKTYTTDELFDELDKINCNTVSFTGGEPLMDVEFLKEFLIKYKSDLRKKIYLETNGILFEQLSEIIDYVDIVIARVLIGGKDTSTLIDGESLLLENELAKLGVLKLQECVVLENSYLRLRYEVIQ